MYGRPYGSIKALFRILLAARHGSHWVGLIGMRLCKILGIHPNQNRLWNAIIMSGLRPKKLRHLNWALHVESMQALHGLGKVSLMQKLLGFGRSSRAFWCRLPIKGSEEAMTLDDPRL